MNKAAYIYDAVRSPRGKGKESGSLHEVKPVDLLGGLLKAIQVRNNLDTAKVDDFIVGCNHPVLEEGCNIARTTILAAGWDQSIPGVQIERHCGSALAAINMVAANVMCGWNNLAVAGGVECMSRVPMGSASGPWSDDPSTSLKVGFVPMGIAADLLATLEGFSRNDVDAFAVESQQKAASAQAKGYFDKSVIPVVDDNELMILEKDEFIKANTTVDDLAKMKPSFEFLGSMGLDDVALSRYPHLPKINHVHHAGNSSGIVDGASALLIGNEQVGKELGLTARARILASSAVGVEPVNMLTGPAPAAYKALGMANLKMEDIDLFEINEAFSCVPLHFQKLTKVPWKKINVNGGAIALGHPLGATGGILVGTLLDEMERRDLKHGMVSYCAAIGMGVAMIIERV